MATVWKAAPHPTEFLRAAATAVACWFGARVIVTVTMNDGSTSTETIDRLPRNMTTPNAQGNAPSTAQEN